MTYEDLLDECTELGIKVKEIDLKCSDGRCRGNKIAIDRKIKTNAQKKCTLAEELGHYHLTVGNIVNQDDIKNVKQEILARRWGYEKLVNLNDIIKAFKSNCKDKYEMAEYLNVTIDYLNQAIEYYSNKYGVMHKVDDYIIYFTPFFYIGKAFK